MTMWNVESMCDIKATANLLPFKKNNLGLLDDSHILCEDMKWDTN